MSRKKTLELHPVVDVTLYGRFGDQGIGASYNWRPFKEVVERIRELYPGRSFEIYPAGG